MTEFDILFRNLFDNESHFNRIADSKIPHPVDLYEDSTGLHFEIACTGLSREDICVDVEGDVLKVVYNKPKHATDEDSLKRTYQTKTISKKSFNLAYRISPKYNLTDTNARLLNGLLEIHIPFANESKPVCITIN